MGGEATFPPPRRGHLGAASCPTSLQSGSLGALCAHHRPSLPSRKAQLACVMGFLLYTPSNLGFLCTLDLIKAMLWCQKHNATHV